jgi:hypothetical protein
MAARPTVFVHIGAPKTGTTYLQSILHSNRHALKRAGLLYPGTQHAHFWESQDLRGMRFHGDADRHVAGAWGRLVREIQAWPGRSLIDHESLGSAGRPVIRRVLTDLDFADVHVVITARDLARQLPAMWQERIKNASTESYAEFLAAVRAEPGQRDRTARRFWANHDVPEILARWGRDLPPERVHVVSVPPAGADPGLLWRRFAMLLGLDPDNYQSRTSGANTSLGAAEAAVLRRFNAAIAEHDIPWPVYAAVIKHDLAPALAARRGAAIELPESVYTWAVGWSEQAVKRLHRAGYDIVGDLDELIPRGRPAGLDPDAAPAAEQVEAAAAGMASLAAVITDSRLGRSALRRAQRGPVARKVEDIVGRVPLLGKLRDAYRGR